MSDASVQPAAPIDDAQVAAFWQGFLADAGLPAETAFVEAFQFGFGASMADKLVDLVVHGPKRATAGSVADYEADGDAYPQVGDYWVACGGDGRARAILRTTDVRIGPLSSVDDQFAWDEGEGDRTRADWLRMHTEFFTKSHARIGAEMHPDIPVVFERFEVVYTAE